MSRAMTEKTQLIRTALESVLMDATRPMGATELYQHPDIAALGVSDKDVSNQLFQISKVKDKPFQLRRVFLPAAGSSQKWGYYIQGVVPVVEDRRPEKPKPADPPAPVSGAPEDFTFNPVEFAPVCPEPGDAKVTVPPGVKCITLTVGGVGIRIELT